MTSSLQIVEVTYNERQYSYSGFRVQGTVNGKRIRIRAKDRAHAHMIKIREETKGINAARSLEYLPTHLSKSQLDECEAVLEKLGNRASITEVYEFWHSHHATKGELISLTEAILRYLRHQESRVRGATLDQSRQTLNKFAAAVGDGPVNEITHGAIVSYLDSLTSKDGSPASNKYWNNVKTVIGAFLGWCASRPQEYVNHNVVSDIKSKAKEHKEITTLTSNDVEKLMAHVAAHEGGKHARFFAIATFAGIRPEGELNKLKESDIDLAHNVIKVRPEVAKTKRSRQITIQPNLREWLVRFADQPLNTITEHAYRKVKGQFAKGHDVLRHSFCTNHIHLSESLAITALESGNSEKVLKNHYVNRHTEAESIKFWAIRPPQS